MKRSPADVLTEWENSCFVNLVDIKKTNNENTASETKVGRPKKKLCDVDLSVQTENKILDSIIRQLEKIAHDENVSPQNLLSRLVNRCNTVWKTASENHLNNL